jgi:hypothetical protein
MSGDVHIAGLQELRGNSAVAGAFLAHAAYCNRDCVKTSLGRARQVIREGGVKAKKSEVVRLFLRLQVLGCGEYYSGDDDEQPCFLWSVSRVSAGRAAIGLLRLANQPIEVRAE